MLLVLTMLKIVFFCLLGLMCVNCINGQKSKFIIDNDAGGDDSMAIFLALLYEEHFDGPNLLALTTVNGNTKEENVYHNNQKILKVSNRQDVPIYRGSTQSLVHTNVVENFFGVDGLGDTGITYSDLVPAQNESAVLALIRYSKEYEGELTIIAIGALTNIALAVKLDPGFIGRLKHLYVGAGHIHSDHHPEPEFNAQVDVEAYHILAQNAIADKVTVLPFSQVIDNLNFTMEWRYNVLGALETQIMHHQNRYEKIALESLPKWHTLDPAVVALFLRPDLVQEYRHAKNDIILCGKSRGIIRNEFISKENANVRMTYSFKTEEYGQFLLDVFKHDLGLQNKV